MTLTLICVPPPAMTSAEHDAWFRAASDAAPSVPAWCRTMVARLLADRQAGSDALLLLADALTEAANFAGIEGQIALAIELERLSDIPRRLAPLRADGTA